MVGKGKTAKTVFKKKQKNKPSFCHFGKVLKFHFPSCLLDAAAELWVEANFRISEFWAFRVQPESFSPALIWVMVWLICILSLLSGCGPSGTVFSPSHSLLVQMLYFQWISFLLKTFEIHRMCVPLISVDCCRNMQYSGFTVQCCLYIIEFL